VRGGEKSIEEQIQALLAVRRQIKEADEAYEAEMLPLKAERDRIQEDIISTLKADGQLSARFQKATVSIAVRKTAQVADEPLAVADLKRRGLNDYVSESLNPLLKDVLSKQIAAGEMTVDGVSVVEKE
jgi:hypothetical protein